MNDSSAYAAIAQNAANGVFGSDVVSDVVVSDYHVVDDEELLLFRLIVQADAVSDLDGDAILDANLAVRRAIERVGEKKLIIVKYAGRDELEALGLNQSRSPA